MMRIFIVFKLFNLEKFKCSKNFTSDIALHVFSVVSLALFGFCWS